MLVIFAASQRAPVLGCSDRRNGFFLAGGPDHRPRPDRQRSFKRSLGPAPARAKVTEFGGKMIFHGRCCRATNASIIVPSFPGDGGVRFLSCRALRLCHAAATRAPHFLGRHGGGVPVRLQPHRRRGAFSQRQPVRSLFHASRAGAPACRHVRRQGNPQMLAQLAVLFQINQQIKRIFRAFFQSDLLTDC